ncbi:hypothetical protein P0E55_03880 [Enterococcus faecalis]|uniref:hypothetical protein n=1 Tax=Enterococcus faecalis TaxID=1351 RepID=UPI001A045CA0|nr:hypothetical protein [Enterococcus faecalis]EGO6739765.1 hypothetical protein [Enterococcus faecalis]EGO8250790.1 hypothetical protein [Enterococcus faecalis]EIT1918754.1 hypothetical protein [Enterococcus faecalis]EJF1941244.1 hypothetical protein [Enterococcus faecalis]EJI7179237.1 hypothetical protein [Enterococcus faecalis]
MEQVFLIIGSTVIGGISVFIIKHNLNTRGVYQLYWTTQTNLFSIKVFKGQFRIKANNLNSAEQIGVKKLQEKYQDKEWFKDVKFTVRVGGEKSVFEREDWILLRNIL